MFFSVTKLALQICRVRMCTQCMCTKQVCETCMAKIGPAGECVAGSFQN